MARSTGTRLDDAGQLTRNTANAAYATPDGRYLIVRGRRWRRSNPALDEGVRAALVSELMSARRAIGLAQRMADKAALAEAGARVETAKVELGERGPVWWSDGAPDPNRRLAHNTEYSEWCATFDRSSCDEESHDRPSARLAARRKPTR
jgi:hypothetical protein